MFPDPSVIVAVAGISRRIVPLPEPVLTETIYEVPEPVTVVMDAPVTPVVTRLKSLASTPVTDLEKYTSNFMLEELVGLIPTG